MILGTDHLLCFWNITCVATEKDVFPIVLDVSWLVFNLPLALETLWEKRSGPFKQLAFVGRGPGRGGHSARSGPRPWGRCCPAGQPHQCRRLPGIPADSAGTLGP